MTDTIMEQVIEQVKKAMDAPNSVRLLPHFAYMPTTGCEPSHKHIPIVSHCHNEEGRPIMRRKLRPVYWSGRPTKPSPEPGTTGKVNHDLNVIYNAFPMYCLYYEFHGQNEHTTAGCRGLRKALHELVDKGSIDHFLKRGSWFLQKEREPTRPEPHEKEYSTKMVATIASGYTDASRSIACSYGRIWELCYSTNDGVLLTRGPTFYLARQ
ncbi:hypothetical protein Cgig2_005788 [Carnegiea gigantea]|uniref:Uncharacterized protein n=1 Tax=Carnegiea gigantea TaxID=171969 RepID=A0A9Q1GFV9_9CARY|nr:hypothetical protein Cgig2_005788 [Carnegiea gigantea]